MPISVVQNIFSTETFFLIGIWNLYFSVGNMAISLFIVLDSIDETVIVIVGSLMGYFCHRNCKIDRFHVTVGISCWPS